MRYFSYLVFYYSVGIVIIAPLQMIENLIKLHQSVAFVSSWDGAVCLFKYETLEVNHFHTTRNKKNTMFANSNVYTIFNKFIKINKI